MVENKRTTIGFLVSSLFGDYHQTQYHVLNELTRELDINLIIFTPFMFYTNLAFRKDFQSTFNLATPDILDGIILSAGSIGFIHQDLLSRLKKFNSIPSVSIAAKIDGIHSVLTDNSIGMKYMTSHFIKEHNCKNIAFIRGPETNQEAESRYTAFRQALKEEDLPLLYHLIKKGDYGIQSGKIAMQEIIDQSPALPDAVICANDEMALGALSVLKSHNIRVPEDIALSGFDNIDAGKQSDPTLTTVDQPFIWQTHMAMELLLRLIKQEPVPECTYLPTIPVFRQSCGCTIDHSSGESSSINSSGYAEAKRKQLNISIDETRKAYALGELNAFSSQIMNALDPEVIRNRLEITLPNMEIPSGFLALYNSGKPLIQEEHELPPRYSEIFFSYMDGERVNYSTEESWFKTNRLLPNKESFFKKRRTLLCSELMNRKEHYGYALFEIHNIDVLMIYLLFEQLTYCFQYIDTHTRLKEAYSRLQELDRTKSQFFANISHELRTPLTLILGPLESLYAGEYGETLEFRDEKVASMLHNTLRLLKLINHLLDILKIEDHKIEVKPKKIDMIKLLEFYISTIRQSAEKNGQTLVFINKLPPSQENYYYVKIDKELFEKAFFNLISNALKFTAPGGSIRITLKETEQKHFSVSVSDTGIGIPEDKLDAIFERFTQLDSSASRRFEGAGIGLAFVKDIAEVLGGTITVKSKPGRGSRFTLTFPRGSGEVVTFLEESVEDYREVQHYLLADIEKLSQAEEQEKKSQGRGNKKIVVVEDNPDMRSFLQSILNKHYDVYTARNGKEGLEKIKRILPDTIVSDVMMPVMNGYKMVEALKKSTALKHIPIILLTARAEQEMRIQGIEIGADDYLSKPFNSRELLARIHSLVEMKSLRDELEIQNDLLSGKKQLLEKLIHKQTKMLEKEKNIAIDLRKKTEKQLEEFLLVLASAIESKDHYTGGHVDRVACYARDIAIKLGLGEEEVKEIYLGAIVHDVGKIGVKDAILNKKGKLSRQERMEMNNHTLIGRRLLKKIDDIPIAVSIAYCHQEKWDGTGYPRGIGGEKIPLAARIVTIADVWDAITSDRSYRKAMPLEKAIEKMNAERGKIFDPQLLDLFMDEGDRLFMRYLASFTYRQQL